MPETRSFEVVLTEEAASAVGDASLAADALDFYDSGVWVTHAAGRDFFPYERLVCIREVAAERESEAAGDDDAEREDVDTESGAVNESSQVGERRDAASGGSGSVDGADGEEH